MPDYCEDGKPLTADDLNWIVQNAGLRDGEIQKAIRDGVISNGVAHLLRQAQTDNGVYKWVLDRITPKGLNTDEDGQTKQMYELTSLERRTLADWDKCVKAMQEQAPRP